MAVWALVLLAWLALVIFWVAMLIDTGRHSDAAWRDAGRSKVSTQFLILLSGWIGAAYYYFVIRRDLSASS